MRTANTSIAITWLDRAGFQIKTINAVIYVDPVYIDHYLKYRPSAKAAKRSALADRLREGLERADLILVTHHHGDHCKKDSIQRLARKDTTIVAPQACVRKLGKRVRVVKAGDCLDMDTVQIQVVDAYNQSNRVKAWHPKGTGVGYILTVGGKTIYHAGDTDCIPEMQSFPPIDVALLPIGGRTYTMDMDEAVQAVLTLQPTVVIPMHEIDATPAEFKSVVESQCRVQVVPLQIGQVYCLSQKPNPSANGIGRRRMKV